jgi:hypothetical protein
MTFDSGVHTLWRTNDRTRRPGWRPAPRFLAATATPPPPDGGGPRRATMPGKTSPRGWRTGDGGGAGELFVPGGARPGPAGPAGSRECRVTRRGPSHGSAKTWRSSSDERFPLRLARAKGPPSVPTDRHATCIAACAGASAAGSRSGCRRPSSSPRHGSSAAFVACCDGSEGGISAPSAKTPPSVAAHRRFAVTVNLKDTFESGELFPRVRAAPLPPAGCCLGGVAFGG